MKMSNEDELTIVDEVKPYTPRALRVPTITTKDASSRSFMVINGYTLQDIAIGKVKVKDNG
jgi:hypothetical protein